MKTMIALILSTLPLTSAYAYTYCEGQCTDLANYNATVWGENNDPGTAFQILKDNCHHYLGGFAYPNASGQVVLSSHAYRNHWGQLVADDNVQSLDQAFRTGVCKPAPTRN